MIKAEAAVLKTDKLGRVQMPAERREQLLDEFERSGLSGKKFAALVGVKYQTLATWRQKRQRGRGSPAVLRSKSMRWVEAVVGEPSPAEAQVLVVELPGGARMEIGDEAQAALAGALLRTLGKPC